MNERVEEHLQQRARYQFQKKQKKTEEAYDVGGHCLPKVGGLYA
jgi:hypothetical protein